MKKEIFPRKEQNRMTKITDRAFDEERALYALTDAEVSRCRFAGPADGESALKEAKNIRVADSLFDLRYPLWHVTDANVTGCEMTEKCRAAVWYAKDMTVTSSRLHGIKVFRECDALTVAGCEISSPEAFWKCRGLSVENTRVSSEYPFFECRDLTATGLTLDGKYSFQYLEGGVIRGARLRTKDAFWHAKDVTVEDSEIAGEYLGWYSENLRLVRCRITGTQPLCYCKGLVLEDCTMAGCDLAFEKSEVTAKITGDIASVKNPASGKIEADAIGEIILDDRYADPAATRITVNKKEETAPCCK